MFGKRFANKVTWWHLLRRRAGLPCM